MKIVQILPSLSPGDAVSNDTIALKNVIRSMGYKTEIYAENIDKRIDKSLAKPLKKLRHLNPTDIIIYHKSIGTDISFNIPKYNSRIIMRYHNITPSKFFFGYNNTIARLTSYGIDGAKYLADKVDYCLADSQFNKKDLIALGYKCDIDVLPILIPFEDYEKTPYQSIIDRYSDGNVNILFVGRIAPNKKHEDIIRSFYYYKKYINKSARLFFVGSYKGTEKYYAQLLEYVQILKLEDIYFTGHIKFNEILAYYKIADIFLCLSEHEGFCVPLVEAMYFNKPIIAYNSTATPYTLGGSGILINDKNPKVVAELINRVLSDDNLKAAIIKGQRGRLEHFSYARIRDQFIEYLNKFLEKQ